MQLKLNENMLYDMIRKQAPRHQGLRTKRKDIRYNYENNKPRVSVNHFMALKTQELAREKCPVLTGNLRNSITVECIDTSQDIWRVYSDLPYAAAEHEDITLHHENGEPKFLLNAALEVNSRYGNRSNVIWYISNSLISITFTKKLDKGYRKYENLSPTDEQLQQHPELRKYSNQDYVDYINGKYVNEDLVNYDTQIDLSDDNFIIDELYEEELDDSDL